MPYMEQGALYELLTTPGAETQRHTNWWTGLQETERTSLGSISLMKCPSRRGGVQICSAPNRSGGSWGVSVGAGPRSDYAIVYSGDTLMPQSDHRWVSDRLSAAPASSSNSPFRRARGSQSSWSPTDKMSHWKDGTSNQIIIGEKHIPPGLIGENSAEASDVDGSFLAMAHRSYHAIPGGRYNVGRSIITPAPRLSNPNDGWGLLPSDGTTEGWLYDLDEGDVAGGRPVPQPPYGFGGPHTGVCNFLLGDGAVRSVSVTVSGAILGSYADVRDGRTPGGL